MASAASNDQSTVCFLSDASANFLSQDVIFVIVVVILIVMENSYYSPGEIKIMNNALREFWPLYTVCAQTTPVEKEKTIGEEKRDVLYASGENHRTGFLSHGN